jgi:hypothetical protein
VQDLLGDRAGKPVAAACDMCIRKHQPFLLTRSNGPDRKFSFPLCAANGWACPRQTFRAKDRKGRTFRLNAPRHDSVREQLSVLPSAVEDCLCYSCYSNFGGASCDPPAKRQRVAFVDRRETAVAFVDTMKASIAELPKKVGDKWRMRLASLGVRNGDSNIDAVADLLDVPRRSLRRWSAMDTMEKLSGCGSPAS